MTKDQKTSETTKQSDTSLVDILEQNSEKVKEKLPNKSDFSKFEVICDLINEIEVLQNRKDIPSSIKYSAIRGYSTKLFNQLLHDNQKVDKNFSDAGEKTVFGEIDLIVFNNIRNGMVHSNHECKGDKFDDFVQNYILGDLKNHFLFFIQDKNYLNNKVPMPTEHQFYKDIQKAERYRKDTEKWRNASDYLSDMNDQFLVLKEIYEKQTDFKEKDKKYLLEAGEISLSSIHQSVSVFKNKSQVKDYYDDLNQAIQKDKTLDGESLKWYEKYKDCGHSGMQSDMTVSDILVESRYGPKMVDFLTKKIEEYQKRESEELQAQQAYNQYPEQEQQISFTVKQVRDYYSAWTLASKDLESDYHKNHQFFKQKLDSYDKYIEELEKQEIDINTFPIWDDHYNPAKIQQQYAMQQQTVQSLQTTAASPSATSSSAELEGPDSPAHSSKRQKAETSVDDDSKSVDEAVIKSDKGISVTEVMKLKDVGRSGQPKGETPDDPNKRSSDKGRD